MGVGDGPPLENELLIALVSSTTGDAWMKLLVSVDEGNHPHLKKLEPISLQSNCSLFNFVCSLSPHKCAECGSSSVLNRGFSHAIYLELDRIS